MSIRSRLALSFAVILSLFGLNLLIHLWSNHARARSLEAVRQATTRQNILSSVAHRVSDMQKQVTLLAQMPADALSKSEVAQMRSQLTQISTEIRELSRIADPASREKVAALCNSFEKLSGSWRLFYENVGVDPARAITELAVRAEPLGHEVLQQFLPELQTSEQASVNSATAEVYEIAGLTGRITFAIFLLSAGIAVAVAFLLSHYLTSTLTELRLGAAELGSGNFEHTIRVHTHDELGELAKAFNEMKTSLQHAHQELTGTNLQLQKRHTELEEQRRVSESLLLNILPGQIADELRDRGIVQPRRHDDVTIMFTDFIGFSVSTEQLDANRLVEVLHEHFTAFDQITNRYGLEKLKTIGDSYMCAGGLAARSASHPVDTVLAAMDILAFLDNRRKDSKEPLTWDLRIGIHTGPVIAGVVGINKFAFDVWGTTVNYSSRMESSGVPNRINLSEDTYLRVKDFFSCEYRGKILTKDHRYVDMYLVSGIIPDLISVDEGLPSRHFSDRYARTFERELSAFPSAQVDAAANI